MKSGFTVTSIDCEVSKTKNEKINASTPQDIMNNNPVHIDGKKYKTATVIIRLESVGDVEEMDSDKLYDAINNRLQGIINESKKY